MTIEDLKRLKISGWTVFSRMQAWGWVDSNAREIPWTQWINRKGPSQIGHENSRSLATPVTKSIEDRGLSTEGEWRILRTSNPARTGR